MASEFYQAYLNRHQLAEGWKQAGRKVFGYFCNYTPEEIVHAAGILPVRVRGSSENVDQADAHLPSFCCSYMRSALDQALKGRYGYRRPAGSFFLWLNLADFGGGEAAATTLWKGCGVRVLPGAYLTYAQANQANPGQDFVRLALVHDADTTREGLARIVATLG